MNVFVTGVGGQLGHDVMNELYGRGIHAVGSDIAPAYSGADDGTPVTGMPYVQLDITDREAVRRVLTELHPDAVVHCAAWTAVDAAEDEDKNDKGMAINAGGTANIAEACRETGAIVSAENHNRIGGLGSAVAEVIAEKGQAPFERVGVPDCFGEVGDKAFLSQRFGIGAESIAEAMKRVIKRK